jgi:uncharacterized protein (TIGR03435 family)
VSAQTDLTYADAVQWTVNGSPTDAVITQELPMRLFRLFAVGLLVMAGLSMLSAQSPTPALPAYDVVSIKPSAGNSFSSNLSQRPDGGLTAVNVPVATLISRAYQPAAPADFAGLPDWGMRERWDVTTTSSRADATAEERTAMLRAMLADRFKLIVHLEKRPRDVYELVLARTDGRLGSGLEQLDVDCTATRAAARAAFEAGVRPAIEPPKILPPLSPGGPPRMVASGPAAPCTLRMVGDDLDGQGTVADLAGMFRMATGREVVDRSGLTGFYQITMRFDQMAARRPPAVVAPLDAAPSVFTAVQEQLGMKLVAATASRDTLVIDRLERPAEN